VAPFSPLVLVLVEALVARGPVLLLELPLQPLLVQFVVFFFA
jgi:hypothetical protein